MANGQRRQLGSGARTVQTQPSSQVFRCDGANHALPKCDMIVVLSTIACTDSDEHKWPVAVTGMM